MSTIATTDVSLGNARSMAIFHAQGACGRRLRIRRWWVRRNGKQQTAQANVQQRRQPKLATKRCSVNDLLYHDNSLSSINRVFKRSFIPVAHDSMTRNCGTRFGPEQSPLDYASHDLEYESPPEASQHSQTTSPTFQTQSPDYRLQV